MARWQRQVQVRRSARVGVAVAGAFVLAAAMAAQAAPSGASVTSGKTVSVRADGASNVARSTIRMVGTSDPASIKASSGASRRVSRPLPVLYPHGSSSKGGVAPAVSAAKLVGRPGHASGSLIRNFDGIDAIQNKATAGFNLEPPDEGLGAGNGFVANFVNVTAGIYQTDGRMVAGPFYLNPFFGEPDAANISDPRVFYDSSSHRWFATVVEYQFNSDFTAITESHVDLAVSRSANPAHHWNLYQIPTSNLTHAGCPCLADYPILGVDSQNVYVSTNEFTSNESSFNGAQLYVLSKSQLEAGSSAVNLVYFQNLSEAGAPAFHVQPANEYGATHAEWLMSSLDPNNTNDHRLGVWAVTSRRSVTSGHGMPALSVKTIHSESYAFPPNAQTPKGFCPGIDCHNGRGAPTTGILQTDWDAMQETQFMHGQLIGALNTGVTIPGDPATRSGVAWFDVHPTLNGATVTAGTHVAHQGYLSVLGQYILYPHINMTDNGDLALTYGLTGPSTFPSAAYSVARNNSFKFVKIPAAGTGPDNGFTATRQYGGAGRWGDYSNGEIIPGTNRVWLATQYIPNSGTGNSNWGNRIFELKLP
jgi:hypothetical protein